MDNIIYRQIKPEDNVHLASMIRGVFEEHDAPKIGTVYSDPTTDDLYSLFSVANSILWVAEKDNKAIGCCGIYPTEGLPVGYAELVKFYLPASARGKGIGKKLMDLSLESAADMGYTDIYLESIPQYQTAVGMYERMGFESLDAPMGNSGHGGCNLWMKRKL
jgi:putative acetyltransferase